MNSESKDYLGWALSGAAVLMVLYATMPQTNRPLLFAGAIVCVVANERRRAKIITASLIRIVDSAGGLRGEIDYGGEGIRVSINPHELQNGAVVYASNSWGGKSGVSFNLGYSKSISGGELYELAPSIGVSGYMAREWRGYSLNFSFDRKNDKPQVGTSESKPDSTLSRYFQLS